MKPIVYLGLLAAFINLIACARMQSSVRREDVPPIHRILVVTKTKTERKAYADTYRQAFPTSYEVCALALEHTNVTRNETIRRQAELCRSDVVLLVEAVVRGKVFRFPDDPMNTRRQNWAGASLFHVEMRSVTEQKPFWKAIVRAAPVLGEQLPARSVVRRLLKDGIITGKLPLVQQPTLASTNMP